MSPKDHVLSRECAECGHPLGEHASSGSTSPCYVCDCENFLFYFFPEE